MKGVVAAILSLACGWGVASGAAASPIISGETLLKPAYNFASRGLTLGARGVTRAEGGNFLLPISGGRLSDQSVGVIGHNDAYLTIDNASGLTAILWDLKIDTQGSLGIVTGNILASNNSVNGVSLFVFDMSDVAAVADLGSSPLGLYFTSSLSGFLSKLYGVNLSSMEGKLFGFVTARAMTENYAAALRALEAQNVIQNPVPASVLLFLTGAAGLFARFRRRTKSR